MITYTLDQLNEIMTDNGGSLYLRGTRITNKHSLKHLVNGDYVANQYLYADGILTHVKSRRKVGEYLLYVGKIPGKNVVSDGTNYAHCASIREGISDLLFKRARDRGAEQYKGYRLDSLVQFEDAVTMYRIITGACRQGTQQFIDNLPALQTEYTVKEIVDLTAGQYGAEAFRAYFGK